MFILTSIWAHQQRTHFLHFLGNWLGIIDSILWLLEQCRFLPRFCKDLGIVINMEELSLEPKQKALNLRMLVKAVWERVYALDSGFVRFQALARKFLSPFFFSRNVATIIQSYDLAGMIYSAQQAQHSLLWRECIIEGPLVLQSGWAGSASPCLRGTPGEYQMMDGEGQLRVWSSTSVTPSVYPS